VPGTTLKLLESFSFDSGALHAIRNLALGYMKWVAIVQALIISGLACSSFTVPPAVEEIVIILQGLPYSW
jgi:hypothetical protein